MTAEGLLPRIEILHGPVAASKGTLAVPDPWDRTVPGTFLVKLDKGSGFKV